MARPGWYQFPPYVPAAARRAAAARAIASLRAQGRTLEPVPARESRTIATSFWGRAWCDNLERYSDFATRLPRGRSYLKNGLVIDLQIAPGRVTALVSGSDLYQIAIDVGASERGRWAGLVEAAAGAIDSVVDLLEGRVPAKLLERIVDPARGLFPAPRDIRFSCSCPDSALMCKHVAAALYGVGARLDSRPDLFFVLRGLDQDELVHAAGRAAAGRAAAARPGRHTVPWQRLPKVFGIDLDLKRPRHGAKGRSPR